MADELSRRDMLENALEQSEEGTLDVPDEKTIEVVEDNISQESVKAEADNEIVQEEPAQESAEHNDENTDAPKDALPRPSTWKKEYLPIWDKITTGQQLTAEEGRKLAEYSNQRESEYKKGVSTYKQEADRARGYEEAIAPFVPELQKQGISPAAWINNLGRAHMVLSTAPQNQKIEMFQRLAQDYGIQLNSSGEIVQQQQDPYTQQLMQQLQYMNNEVSTIKGKFQQEEDARLQAEISKVSSNVEKFPHFEAVREQMAQLLESGFAQDLETAYAKAVRMNDDVWSIEQERLLTQAQKQVSKAQQVAKAKAAAVSPRSVTPNGTASAGDKKDRRSILAEQMEANNGGRV
jgi:hypothetical protein